MNDQPSVREAQVQRILNALRACAVAQDAHDLACSAETDAAVNRANAVGAACLRNSSQAERDAAQRRAEQEQF